MEAGVVRSIVHFDRTEWNACFAGDCENWDFYRACESAGPQGFSWHYAFVRERGRLVATVPAFGTSYRLDATVEGPARRLTERLYRAAPRLMSVRLLAAGSPVAEICHLGFPPDIPATQKPMLLGILVDELRRFARSERYRLLAVKDAPGQDSALWEPFASAHGFHALPALPTACLDLSFGSLESYLSSLSRATRRDLRRKQKAFSDVSVEARTSVDDVLDELGTLYAATVERSELRFEPLSPDYFRVLLSSLAPNARAFLYRAEGRLIGFNLCIEDENRLVDKYLGMDHSAARRYSLYFNSWLHNVQYCIERGIRCYQSGQGFYGPKLRLGCELRPNRHYFRHSSGVIDAILWRATRAIGLDRQDAAVEMLMREAT